MVKKETVGKSLKKAARILPGIGSYQDREASRESDKELRMQLSRRLDEYLGSIEWLKTDQARKGNYKRLNELEDLSRHLEKVSRMVQFESRGYSPLFADHAIDEGALDRLLEYDKGLWEGVSRIGEAVQAITADRKVPVKEEIGEIRKELSLVEKRLKERESLFKASPQ